MWSPSGFSVQYPTPTKHEPLHMAAMYGSWSISSGAISPLGACDAAVLINDAKLKGYGTPMTPLRGLQPAGYVSLLVGMSVCRGEFPQSAVSRSRPSSTPHALKSSSSLAGCVANFVRRMPSCSARSRTWATTGTWSHSASTRRQPFGAGKGDRSAAGCQSVACLRLRASTELLVRGHGFVWNCGGMELGSAMR